MSAARLAIGPNIYVARISGDAFRPLGVRLIEGPDSAEAMSRSSQPTGFQPRDRTNLLPVLDGLRPLFGAGV